MLRKNFKALAKTLMNRYETNDPFKIAKLMNIQIIFMEFKTWMGLYTEINGVKTIYISSLLSEILQKIVCSHELGHGQQTFKEAAFMKEDYLFGTNRVENEANEFAAELMKYQDEVCYKIVKKCDLGFSILEEIKKYIT